MLVASTSSEPSSWASVCGNSLIPGAQMPMPRIGYDSRDRMVSVTAPGVSAAYGYDTQGLRVRMDDGAGDRRTLMDARWERLRDDIADYSVPSGERLARWDRDLPRTDALLGQASPAGKTAAVTDVLGSVHALVDAGGLSVSRFSYDAYGSRTAESEEVPTDWSFTGRRRDPSTQQLYYRARYYEPSLGRFAAVDPLLSSQRVPNAFAYVGGRPTRYIDPTGEAQIAVGEPGQSGLVGVEEPGSGMSVPLDQFQPPPLEHWGTLYFAIEIANSRLILPACEDSFEQSYTETLHECPSNMGRIGIDAFDNATIYFADLPTPPGNWKVGLLGISIPSRQPATIAYTGRAYELGPWALTHNFVHELTHTLIGTGEVWTKLNTGNCTLGQSAWEFEF